jgi:transcription antitermination factor NusG
MTTTSPAQWYAVYTRPRSEKKVALTLADRGLHTWCPLQRVRKRWHDRVKFIEEPVFASYVFVQITDRDRGLVLSDPNVVNFVRHCGKPAPIRDSEMAEIKGFLEQYEGYNIQLSEIGTGDTVRISKGPFTDYSGIVIRKNKHKASIRFKLFNAYLVAELDNASYTRIEACA